MSDKDLHRFERGILLAGGGLAFMLGILGGLWRQDWDIPLPDTHPASFHGALTVGAFLALIGLEHAQAWGRRRGYASPACAALGALATAFGAPHLLSASLLTAGSALHVMLAAGNWRRDRATHAVVGVVAALAGAAGNAFWLAGLPAVHAAGAWLAFLVLAAVSERLELSEAGRAEPAAPAALAAVGLLLVCGALALPWAWKPATLAMGAGLTGLSLWLLNYDDDARRGLRFRGEARFRSACLIGGYGWLGIGGLALPFAAPGGPLYDAALHAVFLGFVIAMLMAHATAVFPVLLGIALPWRPIFYAHLALLGATLALRVGADFLVLPAASAWGGLGNALALALFVAAVAVAGRRGARQRKA